MPIYFIDRKTGERMEEVVFGDRYLRWVYETKPGALLLETIVKRKLFSSIYGKIQDMPYSKRNIHKFVNDLNIDLTEALIPDIGAYTSFNEFFIRKLNGQARPVVPDDDIFVSPADGRVLAWENIDPARMVQVKGLHYSLAHLLADDALAAEFAGGTCLIIRLCPSDYHRLHFPDSGVPARSIRVNGHYYSVNPRALHKIPQLYCENKRELTLFESDHFGRMALIEVGATCVGSIVQTYEPHKPVKKGDEKAYFKFGGSTMIVLLKQDALALDRDLIVNTENHIETKVLMGERLGAAKT